MNSKNCAKVCKLTRTASDSQSIQKTNEKYPDNGHRPCKKIGLVVKLCMATVQ